MSHVELELALIISIVYVALVAGGNCDLTTIGDSQHEIAVKDRVQLGTNA